MLVALYGPDGSGKSSLVNNIKKTKKNIHLYHFKPNIFKYDRLSSRFTKEKVLGGNPHVAKPWSKPLSFIKLALITLDYIFFYIKKRRLLLSKNEIVIFDRYFLDIKIDKKRNRLNLSSRIIDVFYHFFIPKPQYNFFLLGDPEIIYKRKNELSYDRTKALTENYRSCASSLNGIIIDTAVNDQKESLDIFLKSINDH